MTGRRSGRRGVALLLALTAASCGGAREGAEGGSRADVGGAPAPPAVEARAQPAAPTVPAGYTPGVPAANAGTVRGSVRLEGPVPKLARKEVTQDHAACGKDQPNPALLVGKDLGLEGAVVRLIGIGAGKSFPVAPLLLDQRKCSFVPHVTVVPAGSRIQLRNSDPVAHNVHAYDAENTTLFNISTPLQGVAVEAKLEKPGPVRLKCDVHPWMSGWFFVADTPYVTATDKDGGFEMTGVPPGTYRIVVWHEVLGERTEEIVVPPGGSVTKDIGLRAGG